MDQKPPSTHETLRYFAKKFPELDVTCIETTVHLMRVARELIDAFDAHFARHNLSKGRFMILMTLMRQEGGSLSPAELADCCGVTRATVTGLLDTLAAAGLVERIPDENDRRALKVRMLPAGQKHLDGMLNDHYRRIATLMQPLTVNERGAMMTLLNKIQDGIPVIRDP